MSIGAPADDTSSRRLLVVLNNDLFTGVRIKDIGKCLGFEVRIVKVTGEFASLLDDEMAALGIIDLSFPVDWEVFSAATGDLAAPFIAFGPHKEAERLRAAKEAGAVRVMANSEFQRNAASMIERYARKLNPGDTR